LSDTAGQKSILALHRGSTTPLEQILFNKINLFSVVYQHPKVRAAEAMFHGILEYIRDNHLSIESRSLEFSSDFLWITDDRFFGAALSIPSDDPLHRMIHDILYRRHFVRALTISHDTVDIKKHSVAYQQILNLVHPKDKDCHDERRAVAREIWDKAGRPHTPHHIWLDLPPTPRKGEADNVYVCMPGRDLIPLSEIFPLDYWSEFYTTYKWRGHVFCPPDCQVEVHKAAVQVLEERFGIQFNKYAAELSHIDT
jgi:HD superfamily phosphohydrolase